MYISIVWVKWMKIKKKYFACCREQQYTLYHNFFENLLTFFVSCYAIFRLLFSSTMTWEEGEWTNGKKKVLSWHVPNSRKSLLIIPTFTYNLAMHRAKLRIFLDVNLWKTVEVVQKNKFLEGIIIFKWQILTFQKNQKNNNFRKISKRDKYFTWKFDFIGFKPNYFPNFLNYFQFC